MPTVLDELLVQTRVDLSGLQSSIRQAEAEVARAHTVLASRRGATFSLAGEEDANARAIGRTAAA